MINGSLGGPVNVYEPSLLSVHEDGCVHDGFMSEVAHGCWPRAHVARGSGVYTLANELSEK